MDIHLTQDDAKDVDIWWRLEYRKEGETEWCIAMGNVVGQIWFARNMLRWITMNHTEEKRLVMCSQGARGIERIVIPDVKWEKDDA